MIGSRWNKVINDLFWNKTRTALIVLSISVGLFAIGAITGSQAILSTEMDNSYASINPSSGTIRTIQPFDEGFVQSVAAMEQVAEVEARYSVPARVQLSSGKWRDIAMYAVADYQNMRVNKILPQSGDWPPPERQILIERAALPLLEAQIGDMLLFEFPSKQQRWLRIAGTAHDLIQLPAQIDGSPYGYVSFDTMGWFGEPYGFNELHIVAVQRANKEQAQAAISQVKSKAEKSGYVIPLTLTAEPGQVPLNDILQAVLLLLGALGLLSLFLSAFLIINTVSALLAQQKRQIGVMKAIGASTSQLLGMYLVMTAAYGIAALAISLPLSSIGTQALSNFMSGMFNFDLANTRIPVSAIQLQIIVGLGLPIMASLYPFLANLRLSAAETMSVYQTGKNRLFSNPINRLTSGSNLWFTRRFLARPLLLSIRNTFRNQGRLTLTLMTLTLASALFIGVFNLRASLSATLDDLMRLFNYDIIVSFERPYRIERILSKTGSASGVALTGSWSQYPARLVRQDDSETGTIFLFAINPDSPLTPSPAITAGRWLAPGDENALVVNSFLLKEEPEVQLGQEVVLKLDGQERRWRVVGVCMGVMAPMVYADQAYVTQATGDTGRANVALISLNQHDQATVDRSIVELYTHFERAGFRVSNINSSIAERNEAQATFSVIVNLLFIMAILLALVGGLGLMGTMSINVLERTREIGVLRAIGAPGAGVAWVFIREGIAIGLLSWSLGALLAIPLSQALGNAVGVALMGTNLTFAYSTGGLWLWMALVLFISALASFIPARNASRLTVREVLAYE